MDNLKKIVESNIGLVADISKSYFKFGYDDIFQVGCIGLIKAVQDFDVHKGYKFSTYAYIKIKGEILSFLRKRNSEFTLSLDYMIKSPSDNRKMSFSEIVSNDFNLEEYMSLKIDLMNCIHKLPEMYRKVLLLKMEGLKQREIAECIGISQNSVSRCYRNACKTIKKYLLN